MRYITFRPWRGLYLLLVSVWGVWIWGPEVILLIAGLVADLEINKKERRLHERRTAD